MKENHTGKAPGIEVVGMKYFVLRMPVLTRLPPLPELNLSLPRTGCAVLK